MAVTWELKINFLRPAIGTDLVADASMRKFGRLSFIDVSVHSAGDPARLVAHATVTYVVPLTD
jgi:acyl-coenzyme A thioesterase PaaI-like protein